eukprot:TRINITY_DN73588_c0_g1_i1.p1 TRINITY_DN73588_c0_g1~~TRINITY_DN73588_c0_g1_i1.p1  ORF type:complete len:784 (-),score=97.01 TRINITY_DN73588_c0_g1_i1:722-3073(-)
MVKKALCVGCNYPNTPYQLYGCVNDCLDWERLLKEQFEFDETRVLIDQNPDGSIVTAPTQIPTRQNILAQLGSWLVAGAQQGDVLVFMFAGAGCQVRTSHGQIDEALVPQDYSQTDAQGNHSLVMDDEVHALISHLPPGSYITLILDCCHGAHMLDVPTFLDTSAQPFHTHQTVERPREVYRTPDGWEKAKMPHAQARARFVPTLNGGPRKRRTQEGSGAHVGRMTLDPGVTAFCFSAGRTHETGYDANIKNHQRGVLSFCLFQGLSEWQNLCTYEQWLEKATTKLEDIRAKYMPGMDQTIQLSFCPNSAPSEVVVFDPRYATVAQHRQSQQGELAQLGSAHEDLRSSQAPMPQAVREASTDFVPAPMYSQADASPHAVNVAPAGLSDVGILYVQIFGCYNLKNTDTGILGDVSDPYVRLRVADVEHSTPVINNNLNPVWHENNKFTFKSHHVQDDFLQLEVVNSNMMRDDVIGRLRIPLRTLPPKQWEQFRQRLQEGQGEIEYQIRLDPEHGSASPSRPVQPMSTTIQAPAQAGASQYRPPSPPRDRGTDFGRFGNAGQADLGNMVGARLDFMRDPPQLAPMDLGQNIFGQPNLIANMPDLLANLRSNAERPLAPGTGRASVSNTVSPAGSFTPMLGSRAPAPSLGPQVQRGLSGDGFRTGALPQVSAAGAPGPRGLSSDGFRMTPTLHIAAVAPAAQQAEIRPAAATYAAALPQASLPQASIVQSSGAYGAPVATATPAFAYPSGVAGAAPEAVYTGGAQLRPASSLTPVGWTTYKPNYYR